MESKTGNIFFERISVFGNESFFSEYASGFRFGFNGKEKTDELYGTGNAYDYGMRMYDARLGRFLSVDPLFAKYSYQSPYSFVGNSPFINKEFDGKDYGVYVDYDTKTIIIKATYYTVKGDAAAYKSASDATTFWNKQSGKFQYVVGKGNDAVRYNITFQLDVKPVDNPTKTVSEDHIDFSKATLKPAETNTYIVKPDDDKVFKSTDENEKGAGDTQSGILISVAESEKSSDAGGHEIGHTLGISHKNSGIMTPALNDPYHSSSIDKSSVQDIFDNLFNPKGGNYGKGTIHEKGTKQTNFNTGKVVTTPVSKK